MKCFVQVKIHTRQNPQRTKTAQRGALPNGEVTVAAWLTKGSESPCLRMNQHERLPTPCSRHQLEGVWEKQGWAGTCHLLTGDFPPSGNMETQKRSKGDDVSRNNPAQTPGSSCVVPVSSTTLWGRKRRKGQLSIKQDLTENNRVWLCYFSEPDFYLPKM